MVKGKRLLGVVWRESCRNSVSEEVETELQKVVTKTLRPLSRSWFGVVLKAWDRPLTDLHISAWSVMTRERSALITCHSSCSDTVVVFSEERLSQQRSRHKVRVMPLGRCMVSSSQWRELVEK